MFNYKNRVKGYIFWNTIGLPFKWVRKLLFKAFLWAFILSMIFGAAGSLSDVLPKEVQEIVSEVNEYLNNYSLLSSSS